ncbi:MAG: homoserine dehydrogenase, partial [Chloroflexaceae bacterium]|nr:homoserine dehydrogenase [Chloroflexaceae bacterium]
MHIYPFILTGLGNIGRNLLEILLSRGDMLERQYGFGLRCVGVADSSGAAYDPAGLDMAALVALKRARRSLAEVPAFQPGWDGIELTRVAEAEFLLEATPTSLSDGQPGLDIVRTALRRGIHAVLASKGPLVLAFGELEALCRDAPPGR